MDMLLFIAQAVDAFPSQNPEGMTRKAKALLWLREQIDAEQQEKAKQSQKNQVDK